MTATLTSKEEQTLRTRAYRYAEGRKDAQPEKFKNMNPDLFAITVQNSYARWKSVGTTARWQGIVKTFEQYSHSFA